MLPGYGSIQITMVIFFFRTVGSDIKKHENQEKQTFFSFYEDSNSKLLLGDTVPSTV